jgi:ankyrin repeat-rich membrane spanning protein
LAQLLIDKGANIDARNRTGWTALIWASVNGYKEMVELLIKNGANLNIKNIDGWSALIGAVFKNHYNIAQLLIENGIVVNVEDKYLISAMIFTYDKGYSKLFKLLFEAEVNSENIRDKQGNTLLIMATRLELEGVVKSLLENGANVNERNNDNETALIWASQKNNKDVIEILLEYKPKLDLIDKNGWSALKVACRNHQTKDIVELLVDTGANINQISEINDVTPLKTATWNEYDTINGIEEFLESKGAIIIL